MPTDIPTFRARLLDERSAVQAELASVDMTDETAKYNAALAIFETQQNTFNKASRRWALIQEKVSRVEVLDAQIALVTP